MCQTQGWLADLWRLAECQAVLCAPGDVEGLLVGHTQALVRLRAQREGVLLP